MAFRRLHLIRVLYRTAEIREPSNLKILSQMVTMRRIIEGLGSSRSYSSGISNVPEYSRGSFSSYLYKGKNELPWTGGKTLKLPSVMAAELSIFLYDKRSVTTQAKAPPQVRQMGALKVSMTSPGFVYEPYAPREPISFWKRWFTRSGWRRTKDDIILELKSAYAINKLRKSGYSKKLFYNEAANLYKEINTLMANGEKTSLRKAVTEKMYSALKNEIKQRESKWTKVYWELVEPIVKIRTLRARLIGVDRNDLSKVFIQLTLEFLAKQKFEAYDSKGAVVAGDKTKEVLVRDIWVFEKSLFHPGAYWRLCGRISS
ncbi:39S ribosomal protein L45 mitochondrial [Quillaja saponaria]|uniref:Large ribosomal subunit protein mL45 n=1 Tax=Quillaja saponaria TaxID=32244 RepID=A0AAD7VJI2_QUISA|nr:39S ribosomal protein L45 mitochondrial [Quillaja saponaria]